MRGVLRSSVKSATRHHDKRALVLLVLLLLPLFLLELPIAHAEGRRGQAGYIQVPFHYQTNSYYCGPAALEMVFDYYGQDISQKEIAEAANTNIEYGGTFTDELRRAAHFSNLSTSIGEEMPGSITGYSARPIGYAAFEQWDMTISNLKGLVDAGYPVVVLMWWSSSKMYGHFRVVVGYNTTHVVTHDPWRLNWGGEYGGANVSMTYSTFLDLWDYSFYWGLFVHPLDVELTVPQTVLTEAVFNVSAVVTYPCPSPFNSWEYPASSCNATIQLPDGLQLVPGETSTHTLGTINAGGSAQTSWTINASEKGFKDISIVVTGAVEGSAGYPTYFYEDVIGGSDSESFTVLNAHDLAITAATLSTPTVVRGYFLHINVTVFNCGMFSEAFNVSIYANDTTLETRTVELANGTSTTTQFSWNTSDIETGEYTITAYASPVPNETDTTDNIRVAGSVSIVPQVHDIAILDLTSPKTAVGQSCRVSLSMMLENQGNVDETVNLAVFAGATALEARNVSIPAGSHTTLTIIWDTTGWAKGNYTISASSETLLGETDTSDNTLSNGWVLVTLRGDTDADRDVDIFDIVRMAGCYGVKIPPPNPRYDPNSDIDGDGDIDIFDIVMAAANYGASW